MRSRRKRYENSEEPDHSSERWLVSYADFITLMFAFFAILYATSQKDVEKAEEFQESVKKYLIKAGGFGDSGQQINQGTKSNSVIEEPIESFTPTKATPAEVKDDLESMLESQISKEDRKKYLLDFSSDDWGFRIVLPSGGLFAENSNKFRPDAMEFMGRLSQLLSSSKRKILIEGHVTKDEVGNAGTTWEFAASRSINVLRYIQKREKLEPNALVMASLGDSRPLVGASDRKKDSRIEIILLNPEYEF